MQVCVSFDFDRVIGIIFFLINPKFGSLVGPLFLTDLITVHLTEVESGCFYLKFLHHSPHDLSVPRITSNELCSIPFKVNFQQR